MVSSRWLRLIIHYVALDNHFELNCDLYATQYHFHFSVSHIQIIRMRLSSKVLLRAPTAMLCAPMPYRERPGYRQPVRRLAVVRPDLVGEWVPEMNDVDVSVVPVDATDVVTWRCGSCSHQWSASVQERAMGEAGCPECTRRVTSGIGSLMHESPLSSTHKELVAYWDDVRNGSLRPSDVHAQSTRVVWWISRDGLEAFQRPVYAFVYNQCSPREECEKMIDRRAAILKEVAPLCGYDLPIQAIDYAVSSFRSAAMRSSHMLGSTTQMATPDEPGSLKSEEVKGFEEIWSAAWDAERGLPAVSDEAKASTPLELHLDTSINAEGQFPPSLPVIAVLDRHAEEMLTRVVDFRNYLSYAEAKKKNAPPTTTDEEGNVSSSSNVAPDDEFVVPHKDSIGSVDIPSYLLRKEEFLEFFTLPDAEKKRRHAKEVAAAKRFVGRRFRQKPSPKDRTLSAVSETSTGRAMPGAPTAEDLLKADDVMLARGSEVDATLGEAVSDPIPTRKPFMSKRGGGFTRMKTLSMPDEDEGEVEELVKSDIPTPAAPIVEAPSAPRVVARRRK